MFSEWHLWQRYCTGCYPSNPLLYWQCYRFTILHHSAGFWLCIHFWSQLAVSTIHWLIGQLVKSPFLWQLPHSILISTCSGFNRSPNLPVLRLSTTTTSTVTYCYIIATAHDSNHSHGIHSPLNGPNSQYASLVPVTLLFRSIPIVITCSLCHCSHPFPLSCASIVHGPLY